MLTQRDQLSIQVAQLHNIEIAGKSSSTLEALFVIWSHSVDNPCELVSHPLVPGGSVSVVT